MATLRSPGVVVREKDLTNGRADITNGNIAGFASPFVKGEIGSPVTVGSESELIAAFGEPVAANAEYWLSATNYLSYGGALSVVRVDDDTLKNSIARVGSSVTSITVTNASTNGKYVSAPVVEIVGDGVGASAIANIDENGRVFEIVVTDTGSGFSSAPTVNVAPVGTTAAISAARGTTAEARITADNLDGSGGLQGTLTIDVAGSGYSSTPTVTLEGTSGTGATITTTVENGQIIQISVSGGTNYNLPSAVTITGPTGLELSVDSSGSNYDQNATYNVSVTGGEPNTPLIGTLNINQAGIVTGVNITNFGDYTTFTGLGVVVPEPGTRATATATITADPIKINNFEVYSASYSGNTSGWLYAGRTAGAWGNSLRVCTIDNGPRQSLVLTTGSPSTVSNITIGSFVSSGSKKGKVIDVTTGANSATVVHVVIVDSTENDAYLPSPAQSQLFAPEDSVTIGSTGGNTVDSVDDGSEWYLRKELYPGSGVLWNSIAPRPLATADAEAFYGSAAVRDAVHVAVVDEDGLLTGAKNSIVEVFTFASKATNARGPEGGTNFYKSKVSSGSTYVYVGDTNFEFQEKTSPFEPKGGLSYSLTGGQDYNTLSNGLYNINISTINSAYDIFENLETVSIDYLIMGPGMPLEADSRSKLAHIAGIAARRKDCIAFGSPHKSNIVSESGTTLSNAQVVKNIKDFYAPIGSNSYLVFDSNYKYVYDRWNDVYRYIPCNTDVAGLVADTTIRNEPWFSPAGFSRGGIRNVAKLAWNPSKSDRDELYANRVNPIAVFPGQGAVLFGDKTALSNPSAFDRINVRKLFLVLERAIEQAAKAQLFEINDETTRSIFKSIVEPFLRDVQARRGVYDYLVVCDESNNTPVVIDNNEFVAEIYVQPARSINFVTLTFIATRTGIEFSEVIAR
jgi:hypothetical protein